MNNSYPFCLEIKIPVSPTVLQNIPTVQLALCKHESSTQTKFQITPTKIGES